MASRSALAGCTRIPAAQCRYLFSFLFFSGACDCAGTSEPRPECKHFFLSAKSLPSDEQLPRKKQRALHVRHCPQRSRKFCGKMSFPADQPRSFRSVPPDACARKTISILQVLRTNGKKHFFQTNADDVPMSEKTLRATHRLREI